MDIYLRLTMFAGSSSSREGVPRALADELPGDRVDEDRMRKRWLGHNRNSQPGVGTSQPPKHSYHARRASSSASRAASVSSMTSMSSSSLGVESADFRVAVLASESLTEHFVSLQPLSAVFLGKGLALGRYVRRG